MGIKQFFCKHKDVKWDFCTMNAVTYALSVGMGGANTNSFIAVYHVDRNEINDMWAKNNKVDLWYRECTRCNKTMLSSREELLKHLGDRVSWDITGRFANTLFYKTHKEIHSNDIVLIC